MILTGGLNEADEVRAAFEQTGVTAVMLARGVLGNPWLFRELLTGEEHRPSPEEVCRELEWTMACAGEHLGAERGARYARKFYPWFVERLGLAPGPARTLQEELQRAPTLEHARGLLSDAAAARRRPSPERRAAGAPEPAPRGRYTAAPLKGPAADGPVRKSGVFASPAAGATLASEARMPKDVILTPEGLQKLKDELDVLQTEKRREVAERIKEAREFGDIAENSEYDDAKNEQAMLEARIAQLQEKLRMASVIEAKDLSTDVVQIGSVVHVKDEKTGKSVKYTIVGSAEAKPDQHKLSNESPVGRALLGHKRNDIVAVKVPRGPARKLKITKIDVGLE